MSTPKKPGTDLAALKARLAKKNKPAQAPSDVPAPGEVIPAPGQVIEAAPPPEPEPEAAMPPQAHVPPPGQPMHVPAPGEVMQPPAPAQPQPQPQPQPTSDDPFGAPGMGGFDPTEGIIDAGGEIQARGSKGLVVFAALLAAGFGAMAGWLGHKILDTRERVEVGKRKGAEMAGEVATVADARKSISLAMDDLEKKVGEDPQAGAKAIEELLKQHFDKHPKVDALFGWQLASVHASGIRRTFDLYEEANRLKLDLAYLARHLTAYDEVLKNDAGPLLFGLYFKASGAQLVLALAPLCGEGELDELKPCNDGGDAVAYLIQDAPGSEPRRVPRGTDANEATMLLNDGEIYQLAIGAKPERNAGTIRDAMIGRVKERLEAMAKAERTALKALENYAENPNVDGSNPPPAIDGEDE